MTKPHYPRRRYPWTPEELALIKEHYGKLTYQELHDQYIPLHSPATIQLKVSTMRKQGHVFEHNLAQKTSVDNRNINKFADVNLESAYWAGFIAADGHLCPKKQRLIIGLQRKDADHLEQLKEWLGCVELVTDTTAQCKGNTFPACRLTVNQIPQILIQLSKLFNVPSGPKSFNLKPPLLTGNLAWSYVKGYIDGDGCIYKPGTYRRLRLSVVGNKEVLTWMRKFIYAELPPPKGDSGISVNPVHNHFCIDFSTEYACRIFSKVHGEGIPKGLNRKWDKFIDSSTVVY